MNDLRLPTWLVVLLAFLFFPLLILVYFALAFRRGRAPFEPPYPRREFFIKSQIILSGPRDVIASAVSAVNQFADVNLRRIDAMQFRNLWRQEWVMHKACAQDLADYAIELYHIAGPQNDVEHAIRQIQIVLESSDLPSDVFYEPNRITGSPWDPEPSPWDPEPSPWGADANPLQKLFGEPREDQIPALSSDFMPQWAFDSIGLTGLEKKPSGKGVQVAVFDTSPFDVPPGGVRQFQLNTMQPTPLTLTVRRPISHAEMPSTYRGGFDIRNHGLFGAGLIHAIAEGANIQLVQVLEKDKRGNLYDLLKAIFTFLEHEVATQPQPPQAIVNLSLGIRVPPDGIFTNIENQLRAVDNLFLAAECLGVVVVAAAGNESAKFRLPQAMQFPANDRPVLGVAASTIHGLRSCFSNEGDLAAPGGDGDQPQPNRPGGILAALQNLLNGAASQKQTNCVPNLNGCNGPDCEFYLVGPAYDPPSATGYIRWVGSSFAAPLVSGLAALVVDCGGGKLSPAQVRNAILQGAKKIPDDSANPRQQGLGGGIINIPATLQYCQKIDAPPDYQQEPNLPAQKPGEMKPTVQ